MSDPLYRRLLCPTDFSEASVAPLIEALRIARATGAELTVLHVIHETALDDEEEPDEEMQAFHAELEEKAEERMREIIPQDRRDEVRCVILTGQPVREILRVAVEQVADLVVIGSHGASGVRRDVWGSTGRAVSLLSPVPVLVVRPS